jgi:hypothetical protein
MRAVELTYDIPQKSALPNPSRQLRRCGFRVNLSTWAIPEERVPYPLLHALTEGGASWGLVKYAAEESDKLIDMAVQALRKEVERIGKSAQRSCAGAERKFGAERDRRRYERRCQAALRRARKLLADAESAARCFGVKASVPTDDMCDRVLALREACKARAAVYAGMAKAAQDTALGPAAAEGEVPPLVLADFVEEECEQDASAARVAFAE